MTRELNQLIKKLKTLAPDDIERVRQYVEHLKSPELHGVPVELKVVEAAAGPLAIAPVEASETDESEIVRQTSPREVTHDISPDAEVAHAACAQWRRRPFQTIDADDLQPIAELFREAVDNRAASRMRFGSR